MGGLGALWTLSALGFAFVAGGSVLYLVGLLLAALSSPRGRAGASTLNKSPLRFAVVVPAHNEELVLDATLQSLLHQQYLAANVEIVVVADNCFDRTVEIAQARNVTVLQRNNLTERGKGYALQWAFEKLLARPNPVDAFVVVDADTFVAPNFLSVMSDAINARKNADGLCALQGRYGVLNADENWRTALMAGAFDLFNHVKPLGRDRFGLSVGLKGNGMAFTRQVMQTVPWQGTSITEDIDYGLDLLTRGVRVGYVPSALVKAQMPTTAKQAASQRERWEGGRAKLFKNRVLPLFSRALAKRDIALADAALDLAILPLAELATLLALWGLWIGLGAGLHLTQPIGAWAIVWGLTVLGFAFYVLGGFKASNAPREAYAALLRAPAYAVWKIALMAARPFRRKPARTTATAGADSADEWVRTERAPITAKPTGETAP